jgi:hypothetical protein
MRGRLWCGLLCLLLLAEASAQAAEPTLITLSCDGTLKIGADKPERAQQQAINKVGVVINLAEHTISFAGYVSHVDSVDAAVISFGSEPLLTQEHPEVSALGEIDRVTGMLSATTMDGHSINFYELLCKPASRVF